MIHYPAIYTEAVTPDIIESTDNGTYIGWLSRGKEYDRSLSPEGQPVWRIRFVSESEDGNGNEIKQFLYPNGLDDYSFAWNDRHSLTYSYRK